MARSRHHLARSRWPAACQLPASPLKKATSAGGRACGWLEGEGRPRCALPTHVPLSRPTQAALLTAGAVLRVVAVSIHKRKQLVAQALQGS